MQNPISMHALVYRMMSPHVDSMPLLASSPDIQRAVCLLHKQTRGILLGYNNMGYVS